MKKRIFPILLVMALLIAALSVTAMAATEVAPNEVSDYAKNTMSPLFADGPDYVDTWCPACNANARFYETTAIMSNNYALTNDASHWYISKSLTHGGGYKAPAGKKLCIYLNGCDLTSTGVLFETYGTLNVIGNGTETVSGSNYGASYKAIGATFDIMGGTVNLYGGNYTKNNTNAGPVVGVRNAAATVNIYNGTTVTGGVNSGGNGGNIGLFYTGSALNVYGGTVTGGQAANGGNIGVSATGCTVNISGGTVSGGVATSQGGNILMQGGALNISGTAQFIGGEAKYGGGSIYITGGNTTTITGGTISGGNNTSSHGGGNLCVENAKATISGGTVKDGTAAGEGGNIYLFPAAVGSYGVTVSGTASIENGSGTYGGNIASRGKLDLLGGAVTGGTASYSGATVAALAETAVVTVSGTTVTGGTVTNSTGWGGTLYAEGKGTIKITSGIIQNGNATNGGNIGINNGYLELSGGTVKNGTANYGGNLLLSQFVGGSIGGATITGGTLEGGSASAGGNVYCSSGCKVTMTGLTVKDGTATGSGGNFYVNNAQLTLENCTVSGGEATGWAGGNIYADTKDAVVTVKGTTTVSGGQAPSGGNIAIHDKGTLSIQSGEISQGTAANYGGNIYMSDGTLTQTGGTVKTGTSSTDRGGNLYISSAATATVSNATYEDGTANVYGGNIFNGGTLTVTDTTISGGNAARGGNVHLAGSATFTGCTIKDGTASYGGNIRVDSSATGSFTGCTISNGILTGSSSGGGNMDARGACSFDNCTLEVSAAASGNGSHFYNEALQTFTNCTLTNGTVMGDGDVTLNGCVANLNNLNMRKNVLTVSGDTTVSKVTFNEPAGLHVRKDFTGTLNFASMVGAPDAPIYGKALGANYTAEGDFTGKVILQFDIEEPWACNKDGKLIASASRTVKDGVVTWFADNDKALEGYGDADYLWPLISGTMNMNGDYTVDLAGTNQTITGIGNVTLFDSANTDFKTFGTATLNGPTLANAFATQVEGNTYYTLAEGNTYSFHILEVKISGVSLRPSTAGIYYSSVWNCDDTLKTEIQNFGIAVSVYGQPGADFAEDTKSMYTQLLPAQLETGKPVTSVLITDIFKTTADNNSQRGMTDIYATAYVTLNQGEGTYVAIDGGNKKYSLNDVLAILEANKNTYSAQAETLQNFMNKWNQYGVTGADWDFDYTVAQEVATLNQIYAGNTAYHGEMHDHANTGGRSDGKQTLATWIKGMQKLKMDFATIVDHDQSRHMYLEDWSKATFIGGTETTGWVTDNKATVEYGMFHMNLIFATAQEFEAFIKDYEGVFKPVKDEATGGVIFLGPDGEGAYTYLPETKEYLMELAAAVREHGGFFAHVHPKQAMVSTNVEDYWFGDYTGLEVQYSYYADRNSAKSQANYQLWKDLLAAGKKIYATAGNDEHDMPTVKALTTVYAPENTAVSLVEQMRNGNFNPGPIGIRMAIGETRMGGECDFTGKKLAFVIGDIHESQLEGAHNYRVDLYKDGEVVQSWSMPATGENFYQVVEIDDTANFYRIEVIDVLGETEDRVALSQPIWNTK